MTPDELRRSVERLDSIPSPSFSLNRILELAAESESDIDILAEAVEADPAVTARVLRLANSAYFGVSRDVDSVGRAIVVVGYKNVMSLATCAALAPAFQGPSAYFDRSALWLHSCGTAEACRIVAHHVGHDPATAHVSGLLHDLGIVVLAEVLGDAYGRLLDERRQRGEPLEVVEREKLGLDHAIAAGHLFERWQLPERLVTGVVHHHEPASDESGLGACVGLADSLAAKAGFVGVTEPEADAAAVKAFMGVLSLGERDVEKLEEELEERREAVELLAGSAK